jgi:hypothetical protein
MADVRVRGPAAWFSRRVRQRRGRTVLVVGALAALGVAGAVAGIALSRDTQPRNAAKGVSAEAAAHAAPAIAAILKEFDDHPIVAIGESHDLQEAGDFYRALVRSPSFLARVDAVVVWSPGSPISRTAAAASATSVRCLRLLRQAGARAAE